MIQLNEIKRMQQLAGILNESQLDEVFDGEQYKKFEDDISKGTPIKVKIEADNKEGIITLTGMKSGAARMKYTAVLADDGGIEAMQALKGQPVNLSNFPITSQDASISNAKGEGSMLFSFKEFIQSSTESQLDKEKMDEGKINSEFEKEILKVLKAKFDLDPTTATIDFGPNGMSIKPVNYQVWADKFTKGNQGRNGNYVDDKAQKIAAYFNKKYGKNVVAESIDQLDEIINNALKAAGIK